MASLSDEIKQEKDGKPARIDKIEVDLRTNSQTSSIDVQWINQQLMQGGPSDEVIVKNYLDCGLDSFSLQINEKKTGKVQANLDE